MNLDESIFALECGGSVQSSVLSAMVALRQQPWLMRIHISSTPLQNEFTLNLDESTYNPKGWGDPSSRWLVIGNGGAVAATVANANSYQLQPNCEMNVHLIWTSPFSPLRVGGSVQSSVLSATVAPRWRRRQQWLAADVGKVYSTRLFSHSRRVLCTPGYLTFSPKKKFYLAKLQSWSI